MSKDAQCPKLDPPPRWLAWVFLAITAGLALYPAHIGSPTMMVPLGAANVIFLLWDFCAKRTSGADAHGMRQGAL